MQTRNVLKNAGIIAILSVAVAVGMNCLLFWVNLAQYSEGYQKAAEVLYAPSFAQQMMYSGIFIPIFEELLFRGLLFQVLRRWCSFRIAMVISCLLFGVYHGNLVQFVYAACCGIVLVYLCEKYKSVFIPIWSHMVMNMSSIILTRFAFFSWVQKSNGRMLVVLIACISISMMILCIFQKRDVTKVLKNYCKDVSDSI